VTIAAKVVYRTVLAKRGLRLSYLTDEYFGFIGSIFSSRGWSSFTTTLAFPDVDIIREFYTNMFSFQKEPLKFSMILKRVQIEVTLDLISTAFPIRGFQTLNFPSLTQTFF
jgi:hypothetical protein